MAKRRRVFEKEGRNIARALVDEGAREGCGGKEGEMYSTKEGALIVTKKERQSEWGKLPGRGGSGAEI